MLCERPSTRSDVAWTGSFLPRGITPDGTADCSAYREELLTIALWTTQLKKTWKALLR